MAPVEWTDLLRELERVARRVSVFLKLFCRRVREKMHRAGA